MGFTVGFMPGKFVGPIVGYFEGAYPTTMLAEFFVKSENINSFKIKRDEVRAQVTDNE